MSGALAWQVKNTLIKFSLLCSEGRWYGGLPGSPFLCLFFFSDLLVQHVSTSSGLLSASRMVMAGGYLHAIRIQGKLDLQLPILDDGDSPANTSFGLTVSLGVKRQCTGDAMFVDVRWIM
ncbi:unnamed protein product [Ilex paraguariensis]|uniref:Uncharacterized protein n=1 Tax=Ilex paraguariensis TaxID=185542 RepID=A0ABC8UBR1_9AQUA